MGIDLCSVVCNREDLFSRVAYIIEEYQQPAMVEQFIGGRELAVAMWGNEIVEILPIAEDDFSAIPNPLQHVLTYESKWKPESPLFPEHSLPHPGFPDRQGRAGCAQSC